MPTICSKDKKFMLVAKDIHLEQNEKLIITEITNNDAFVETKLESQKI